MKIISIRKEKIMIYIYLVIILIGVITTWAGDSVQTFSMPVAKKVILIDPGHGGIDSGKIGDRDTFEKDINLQISKKLQSYLEQGGSYVLMTRTTDEALGPDKSSDMAKRRGLANNNEVDILVSIHQNAYASASAKGAQVFYFNTSDNSKLLAECIQSELTTYLKQKSRGANPNSSYYVLRRTTVPAVIVECGFLTNWNEMKNLESSKYQDKVAWGIYMGIIKYFESIG